MLLWPWFVVRYSCGAVRLLSFCRERIPLGTRVHCQGGAGLRAAAVGEPLSHFQAQCIESPESCGPGGQAKDAKLEPVSCLELSASNWGF